VYSLSQERAVFAASLPFMAAAKGHALSLGMNDHGPLHAQRVHALVGYLGALVALNAHERALLKAAALLHDIGMAKDRENHHIVSANLVRTLSSEGKLPFSSEEADVVSTLCEWHRREYDADAIHQGLGVRTGVLASMLRLADAMDLDYRRSEDYWRQESVIAHVHNEQAPHHLSVRSIIGIRLYASQMGTEVQLLVDNVSHADLQLARLVEELIGTPIAWPVKLIPIRTRTADGRDFAVKRRAEVFSYCNAHGIVQAGISKNSLQLSGFSTTVVCDMVHTADPDQFWEKTIAHRDSSDVGLVAILGMHLPKDLEQVLTLVRGRSACRWVYATPLEQEPEKLAALVDAGVEVLIGDSRVLFAGNAMVSHASQWTKVAGLCNEDDWLTSSGGFSQREFRAARGLRSELLKLYESNATSSAYETLVDKVASGELDYFVEKERNWTATLEDRMPTVERKGRVLVLHGSTLPGRLQYDLAHLAIERQGVLAWAQNEFATPYAICRVPRSDGRERVLYLSRFARLEDAIPAKYFVSHADDQLGSGATVWQTYPTCKTASEAIDATVKSINEFFSCED
jgi:hypothetical protein